MGEHISVLVYKCEHKPAQPNFAMLQITRAKLFTRVCKYLHTFVHCRLHVCAILTTSLRP